MPNAVATGTTTQHATPAPVAIDVLRPCVEDPRGFAGSIGF